jgi:hypothetical protein
LAFKDEEEARRSSRRDKSALKGLLSQKANLFLTVVVTLKIKSQKC